jgi:hypothetical protein
MGAMKDEMYARELRAILTKRSDRHDVRVTSVDITGGEHGLELEVGFEPDMPDRGSVRVPFDRRWRRLSGYETPEAYAPEVARQVQRAAARLSRAATRPPSRQVQWQLLLDALAEEGTVRELGPGRIEVVARDGDVVTVVVSPDEWEQVLAWLDAADVGLYVAELIGPRDEDERFVVCYQGELVCSTREELPPVRGRAHERARAEALVEHPDGLYWTGPGGDLRG